MKFSPILIVGGEPNSIFFEIFLKAISSKKFKSPIIIIGSKKLFELQMKKLGFNRRLNTLNINDLGKIKLNNKLINLIDVHYNTKKPFEKISKKSNKFVEKSFDMAFRILKDNNFYKFINGPISKKNFLDKKYLGITEYISKKFYTKNSCMLIYNQNLSVCPVTTHLPIKEVAKKINKKVITEKILLINNFYKKVLGIKPKIAILGLNPHCESVNKFNEDEKIIKPVVNKLKKKFKISGPYPADTIFIKNIRKKFDVIVGMYHDQVLSPFKTLFKFDAINITLGLDYIRVSPDHGTARNLIGKNKANPLSLLKCIDFLAKN